MSLKVASYVTLLSIAFLPVSSEAQTPFPPRKIAVFGSSVARGSGDHQDKGGYAGRLRDLLAPRGWEVVNVSRGGDNTNTIAPRFETELLPQHAGYVIIALSLSNEGIAKQKDKAYRDGIYEQWRSGVIALIKRCRNAGMVPIVGNCYARNSFTADPELYEYTRRMDLEISRWDVPSINLLGAIDDGTGAWVKGFESDDGHPNGSGHQEMFLTIVPSLFEVLEAGKPLPAKVATNRYAYQPGGDTVSAPLAFKPEDAVHSFAMSFRVRTRSDGAVAAITGKRAVARAERIVKKDISSEAELIEAGNDSVAAKLICQDGRIAYRGVNGSEVSGAVSQDSAWHHVVLSHWCARGILQFYIDGRLAGEMPERFIPETFLLGGDVEPGRAAQADLKEWAVYRSSLNSDQVRFLHEGDLFQSSLEVYAPLADSSFSSGTPVENRAQSMSRVSVTGDGLLPRDE